jgi:hypothetical protein
LADILENVIDDIVMQPSMDSDIVINGIKAVLKHFSKYHLNDEPKGPSIKELIYQLATAAVQKYRFTCGSHSIQSLDVISAHFRSSLSDGSSD